MTVHIWSPNIQKIWKILFIIQFTILRKRRYCIRFHSVRRLMHYVTQSNFLRNRGLTKAKHLQINLNKLEPVRYRLASVKAAA